MRNIKHRRRHAVVITNKPWLDFLTQVWLLVGPAVLQPKTKYGIEKKKQLKRLLELDHLLTDPDFEMSKKKRDALWDEFSKLMNV